MTTYKKTIVLNNPHLASYNGSAILTLIKNSDGVMGTLKTFNIASSPNLVLGIAQNNKQVFKQNINLYNNNSYSFKLNSLDLNENLSCVLVQDEPTTVIPLIWGSDNKNNLKEEIISNLNILKNQTKKQEINIQKTIDLDEMFDISNVDEIIDESLSVEGFEDTNNTENNFVKSNNVSFENLPHNFDFNTINTTSNSTNSIIDEEMTNITLDDNETFFESISDQIENLFNSYPAENSLEELIPNSKWVKIDYENNGNFYVLGLIYEDITLKYVCYGVPGNYSEIAPNGLDSYSQWLPTDLTNPTQNGYWVMYQDAITGESVLIDAM